MDDEALISIPVPQNLPEDDMLMGVPVREIAFCLMGPILLAVVLRFVEVDFTIPFPIFRQVMFSNFLIWICGPISFLTLRAWKKRNPDVDLTDAVRGFFGRRSWTAGARDLELPAYLIDPPILEDSRSYEPGRWAERNDHAQHLSLSRFLGA